MQRLHANLSAREVRVALSTDEQWSSVSDAALRRAVTAANTQLKISGAAPDVYTWRCSMDQWSEEQLAVLRALGKDPLRVHKGVLSAPPNSPLSGVFTFATHWTARRLCTQVLNVVWLPASSAELQQMVQMDGVQIFDHTAQGRRMALPTPKPPDWAAAEGVGRRLLAKL